jgi:ribonuclease HI
MNTEPSPTNGIAVDAATHGNPGRVEYRVVEIETGEQVYASPEYANGTNNIGEFLAIVHALAWLKRAGRSDQVYSDSLTARAWVRDGRCKTKFNGVDVTLARIVERAEDWLRENREHAEVRTWLTDLWGEIPADYGRKG